jgi:hypothetical protein
MEQLKALRDIIKCKLSQKTENSLAYNVLRVSCTMLSGVQTNEISLSLSLLKKEEKFKVKQTIKFL